jgi:hypothetical protein
MLSINEFIDKVEEHPLSFFRYSLESIIDEHISMVRDSLSHRFLWELNTTLIIDIQKTVKNIHKKRNVLLKLLSFFLPLDNHKEQEKKNLRILLDSINTDKYHLKIEIEKNKKALLSISQSLEYLERLKDKFLSRQENNEFYENKFFIKEIDDKIVLIEGYKLSLSFRKVGFLELKKVYEII